MADSSDMNTMPIRDLISSLRVQASELPPADMIRMLFVNCMVNRLEQQANLADGLAKKLRRLASMEAMDVSRAVDLKLDGELLARIEYAQKAAMEYDDG